jgi:ketosteroid isomerase-like protein
MSKYLSILIMSLGALTGFTALAADTAPEDDPYAADWAAIAAQSAIWGDAYVTGDVNAAAATFAEDAVIRAPGVPAALGRAAIRAFLAADVAKAQAKGLKFSEDYGESYKKITDGNVAFVIASFGVTDASGTVVATGQFITAAEKINGEWLATMDFWYWDGAAPW